MTTSSAACAAEHDRAYTQLLKVIKATFSGQNAEHLFTTDAPDIWELFLANLPEEVRQTYTCSACRAFVKRYGTLVSMDAQGKTHAAMWNAKTVPDFFKPAIQALQAVVERAPVSGVFLSALPVYGTPLTGVWQHFAVKPAPKRVWQSFTQTAGQAAAQKREEFKMLRRALGEFAPATVDAALNLLRSDTLFRAEKVLGIAEWFKALQTELAQTTNTVAKTNKTWLAVAQAPVGFCHVRSSMIGTLLEDIELGFSLEDVRANFAAKMHPLQYQRPQTAPSAGNIKQAEKIIEQLQASGSLARRFARLEELVLLWKPVEQQTNQVTTGVFGHLKPQTKAQKAAALKPYIKAITWEKFAKYVLPEALNVEFYVPKERQAYAALVTAVNYSAPPIVQWDSLEQRNPCSAYLYHGGSEAKHWNLTSGFVTVIGVCLNPSQWHKDLAHHGKGVFLILENAKDLSYKTAGLALFPEILNSDFHAIRKTIEAYSRSSTLQGFEQASACGLALFAGQTAWNAKVRVTTALGVREYNLERWD